MMVRPHGVDERYWLSLASDTLLSPESVLHPPLRAYVDKEVVLEIRPEDMEDVTAPCVFFSAKPRISLASAVIQEQAAVIFSNRVVSFGRRFVGVVSRRRLA
ncbi:hypothetical protein LX90_009278 [Lentzea flava]|nr:hypothetical protein [Lentzea flava]